METKKSSPKDVFLHLLSIISLYISAGSLIALWFQYINVLLPDKLDFTSYYSIAGSVRWAMASLMIVFPVYLLVNWMLNRDYSAMPEKRELKIRKWLVHFTLFLASLIIITDLVTLVYNFLGGDLTGRFLLKVAAILLVIGTIFGYYLWDLRKQFSKSQLKILTLAVSAVVLGSIVGGFFTAGSPLKARLYRFDDQRISDLQVLQNELINYWIQKDALPDSLDKLANNITGFAPPKDPDSGSNYLYKVSGKLIFELCADFNLPSANSVSRTFKAVPVYPSPEGLYQQNWDHPASQYCFSRTIDPELYKSQKAYLKLR
ncbi:MAG: DUF5671 domain-containing protein [bacterium]|nr:DUF5671 domain-containing protein [bacterium]